MKLRLVPELLFIHPSSLPMQHHRVFVSILPLSIPQNIVDRQHNTRYRSNSLSLFSEGNVNSQTGWRSSSEKRLHPSPLKYYIFRLLRKRQLPRSTLWTISDSAKSLRQRAAQFLRNIILESSLAAAVFALASNCLSAKVKGGFVLKNVIRWMAISLLVRMGAIYSQITSTVPSLDRGESSDWFLEGLYRILLDDNDKILSESSSIPARIRQVPGNGSCLFHAIAAGVLNDQSTSNSKNQYEAKGSSHPPMFEVVSYSSHLRTQAVDTLEKRMENGSQVIMQNDETISGELLVNKAAMQYGLTADVYLSKMRRENVWGGGPEIVALANCLQRQIVLLEQVSDRNENVTYLKATAKLGAPSQQNSIYILSTNQQFPKGHGKKENNHFLAVFPSQHF